MPFINPNDELEKQRLQQVQHQTQTPQKPQSFSAGGNWYSGSLPTSNEMMARIVTIGQQDPTRGTQAYNMFRQMQTNQASPYYQPYSTPTNSALSNLASYGIDVSNINNDWYQKNSWLTNYLIYDGTTNTPTKPGKKASNEQKAAYDFYQVVKSEQQTQAAENEYKALQKEIDYWTNRKDRNYSDDEILEKINWKNYPTLASMDNTNPMQPMEFNRAIGYSKDNLKGIIWAARNDGGTGYADLDTGMALSGRGNQWQENPDISAKLDIGNLNTYSPYSVGSTMEKEGLYFGRESFDQNWLDENRALYLGGNDENAKKMYQSVLNAEKYTQTLETQLKDLHTDIDELLKTYDNPDTVLDILKNSTDLYGDLFSLDGTLESGDLKATTRAVDYRWQDIEKQVRDRCAEQQARKNSEGLISSTTGLDTTTSDAELALEAQKKENVEALGQTIQSEGTQDEKNAYSVAKTNWFDRTVGTILGYKANLEKLTGDNMSRITEGYLDSIRVTNDYENHQKNLDSLTNERGQFQEELNTLQKRKATTNAIMGATQEEYSRLMNLANTPEGQDIDWDMIRETLSNGPGYEYETPQFYSYDEALDNFYRMVALDDQINPEKAQLWFDYISKDHSTPFEKIMADAQSEQSDVDEFGYDVDIPGRNAQLTLNFERDAEGNVSFVDAVDSATNKAYGADQIDEINALLGYNAMDFLTDEENQRLNLLEARDAELGKQIDAESSYLLANESLYQENRLDKDFMLSSYAATAAIRAAVTGEAPDYSLLTGLEQVYAIGQTPIKTQWLPDSAIDLAVKSGELTQDQVPTYAANLVASNTYEADRLQRELAFLSQNGVKLGSEEYANVVQYINELRRSAKNASYCLIDSAADLDETVRTVREANAGEPDVAKGTYGYLAWAITHEKDTRADDIIGLGAARAKREALNWVGLMTDEEKNRYMYLLGKDGWLAANNYMEMLMNEENGAITVRRNQMLSEDMRNFASENGWNAAFATALSFGTKVLGGVSDIIHLVENKVNGTAYSPYGKQNDLSTITQAARGGTKELISEALKDQDGNETTAGKIASLIYDAGTSFGDSMINSVIMGNILGGVFGGTKFEALVKAIGEGDLKLFGSDIANGLTRFGVKAAKDLAHASGMGLEAAASAYREAYITTGGDREKASQMALWTFLAETGSEAITVGNLHDSFAAGGDEAKRGLADFFKNLFKNGMEEFVGEGVNEWVEQNADRLIMDADSKYADNIQSYLDAGYPESVAKELANRQMWKDIWYSGVTGFVSSAFGTGVEYAGGAMQNREESTPAITQENGITPAQATETVTDQGPEQIENTPAITQESVNTPVQEAPASTQQNVTPQIQEQINDNNALENAYGAAPEATAEAITAALGPETNTNKAAAKAWVSTLAGGNTKLAVHAMQEIQRVSEVPAGVLKKTLRYASLTDGAGNRALNRIFDKVAAGTEITADDVDAVRFGIEQDRTSDPVEFNRKYNKAVRDSRIADRTVEIASTPENRTQIENAENQVRTARQNQAAAEQRAEDAQNRAEAIAENLRAAAAEYDPASNLETAGTLEQTRNELMGADNDAQAAEDAANIQRQKTKEAQEKLNETRNDVMSNARAQAVVEVDQQMQEEAQMAYDNGVAAFTPVVPVGRTISVIDNQGNEVKVTGVYDVINDGQTIVYTTSDGGTITSDLVNEATIPADLILASDQMIENSLRPGNRPVAYFPQSIPMAVNGQQTQVIGLVGKETVDGMSDPVIMDSTGRIYSVNDEGVDIDFNYRDTLYDLLTENEDNLPEIARQEETINDNQGSEQVGPERPQAGIKAGTDTEGSGIQGDNVGELPVDAGSNDGRGNLDNAGSGRGEGTDGRNAESGSEPERQELRGVSQRLLSKETTKTLKEKGVTDLKLAETNDQQRFSSALDEAKANNDHGAYVDAQSVKSLQEKGAITILSENGLSGAAVGTNGTEAGNIFGVFKNARSRARKASAGLMIAAIAKGGNKLDCFDGNLRRLYGNVGFIPVARVAFNEKFMPEGWNVERDDHPDVVFWMHNGDSAETVAQKYGLPEDQGGYHKYSPEEIQALPLFEDVTDAEGNTAYGYDRAWEYRDQQLANRQTQQETPNIQTFRNGPRQPQTPTQQQTQKVKGKLKSPQQIGKTLIKALGFGDYTGSNNFGGLTGTLGYWERHAQLVAVKNREMGEYNVTMHEAGHGIAQLLGMQNAATPQMIANMIAEDQRFLQYTPQEMQGEAFAEFFWRYLEDDQRARDFAGDAFVNTFEQQLAKNPNANKAVREARGQLQQWINADMDSKLDALVRYEKTGERSKMREKFRSVVNWLADKSSIAEDVNQFVRDAKGTRELDISDNLRAQALLANHSQKRALVNLTDHLTDSDGNIIGDGLGQRLADAGFEGTEENIHLLERYALLKHSIDRDVQQKPVFGSMPQAERLAQIAEIERTRPDIVAAEQAWQSFRHDFLKAWMVDTGYWQEEFLDQLDQTYPHYVPTFRVRDGAEGSLGITRPGKRYTLHEATGGSQDIYSPYYSFIGMVDQITGMVANNKVAQTFDKLYNEVEGMGIFGRQIPGALDTKVEPGTELNSKQKQLLDLLGGSLSDDIMQQVLDITKSKYGVDQSGQPSNLLNVQREDGTVVQYEIDNPELFKLLTGVQAASGMRILQAVGNLTRTMSMLTTGSNPLFAARNAMRDYQNSVNYGSWASSYATGLPRWISALVEVARGTSDAVQAYKALGGGGWTRIEQGNTKNMKQIQNEMFGDDRSTVGKTAKWLGKKLWDVVTMDKLNEWIEQTSRFVEYKYGKHDLNTAKGRQEAFLAAQDVTVDFSRNGNSEAAYVLKKLVPFFNASMQGVYRTGRQLTEAERGRAGTRLTKTIVNTALTSALAAGLILKYGDEDDKEEFRMLSDGIKANHLILPNPFKEAEGQPPFIRIPLSQDAVSTFVHGLVTNAMMNGSDSEEAISLAATADTILDLMNPLGSGTILQPFIDVSHNRTWFGSNIVRSGMTDWTDKASQYNEDTPEIFKTIGRLVNQSPEIVEYLFQQYTGFIGSVGSPALTLNSNGELGGLNAVWNSIVKKWTADPSSSNDVTKDFYDMKETISTIVNEAKTGRPQGLLLRSLSQEQVDQAYEEAEAMQKSGGIIYETSKLINDTYTKIDQINSNSTLTDDEKYELTRAAKMDMLKQVQAVNDQLAAYNKKYIQGETLMDRIFGGMLKRGQEGSEAHIKTPEEKLPEVFQNDEPYMLKSREVYNETGKATALPHPSQKLTITDRSGNEGEYTIPDDEWGRYTQIYNDAYRAYINQKGTRWETLSETEKQKILTGAHTAGNKAMREQYARENGIRLK